MGEPTSRRDHHAASMPYIGGLDGVRALAIVAVLLYHAEFAWIPGGFLGVEVFFVVSGFLITSLLLAEHARSGRIDLRSFWIRRARRLLPALGLFLAGSYAMAVVLADDVVDQWREEALAATFYVANWFGIANDISYAEGFGRKSFLHHLWSLAVEEQFYLLWPLAVWGGLRLLGRRGTLVATVGLIAGSAALTWLLYEPLTDPTRVYYGTDTRAAGLLIGAALAFVWRPWAWRTRRPLARRSIATATSVSGVAALAVLVWAMGRYDLAVATAEPLFPGGLLITAWATAVVIAAVAVPSSPLGALMSLQPFRWIGTRSYGLYLWHWPIFQVTRPRVDVDLGQWETLALRLVLTVVVTEVSYRLVETPIRRHGVWGALRRDPLTSLARGIVAAPVVALVVIGAVTQAQSSLPQRGSEEAIVVTTGVLTDVRPATATTTDIADEPAATPTPLPTVAPTPSPTVAAVAPVESAASSTPYEPYADVVAPTPTPTPVPTPEPTPRYENVTFFGDSVMEGAAQDLLAIAPEAEIDTEVGRQWFETPDLIEERRGEDGLGDAVVVHLGNNGPINEELFDEMMQPLAEVELVVFVTVRVPLRWEETVNDEIAAGVERYDNAVMVDWFQRSNDRPKFFASDGVHLGTKGRRAYARLIGRVLGLVEPAGAAEAAADPPPPEPTPHAADEVEDPAPPPAPMGQPTRTPAGSEASTR